MTMPRESVQFTSRSVIDRALVNELAMLEFSATGTRRICLHENEDAPLHIMLVELAPDAAYPRHLHRDSDETTIIVQGKLDVVIWTNGLDQPSTSHRLSLHLGDPTAALIPQSTWHRTTAAESGTVYLEVKGGPFDPDALVIGDE